jgi:hypothetical protein
MRGINKLRFCLTNILYQIVTPRFGTVINLTDHDIQLTNAVLKKRLAEV